MKTLPDKPNKPSGPWKPKPGDYFMLDGRTTPWLFLCKWIDDDGVMAIRLVDVGEVNIKTFSKKVYLRSEHIDRFLKPSKKLLKEFVREMDETDHSELYEDAEPDVKEKFTEFMTKISSIS